MSEHLARDVASRIHRAPMLHAEHRADVLVTNLRLLAAANPEREAASWQQRKHELVAAYGLPEVEQRKPFAFSAGKAIVPIHGTLINRFSASWGFVTGYNFIRSQVAAAAADADVSEIVLDINSFGGMCAGCAETADAIYAARQVKPVVGVVDAYAYSAGYMLASAASRLVATPTGGVGSIGVVSMHVDMSKALAEMGVEVTFIHAGAKKVDGNPYAPLSDEARADIQREVDAHYAVFVGQVARNRGLDEQAVRDTEAGTFTAAEGKEIGLVDAVASPSAALAGDYDPEDDDLEMNTTHHPKQEGAMPGENVNGAAPDDAAIKAAAAAERARVAGILGHAEAKGREALANHLATATDMTVEAAAAILAASPKAAEEPQAAAGAGAFKQAMDRSSHPNVGADAENGNSEGDDVVGRILGAFTSATGVKAAAGVKH